MTEIQKLINCETIRQSTGLELIASENYPSEQIRRACGSVLMNKYAEGYPGKRYYGGCEIVDIIEQRAIDKIKLLFNCNFANVQPHSGSQANMAAYAAIDKFLTKKKHEKLRFLTVDLNSGGHLTHGSPASFSSKAYDFRFFELGEEGRLDFNKIEEAIIRENPDVLLTGYSAYPYIINFEEFGKLAKKYNLILLADIAHISGLVAGEAHPSPFPYCDIVTSTTQKTLRGPRGGIILWNNEEYTKPINSAVFPFLQGGPNEAIIAGKCLMAEEALTPEFKLYAQNVVNNARIAADAMRTWGAKCSKTENHMFLLNTIDSFGLTGKDAEEKLASANITVNKNMIPGDKLSPAITSGIRIGLAALTTRGIDGDSVAELFKAITCYLDGSLDLTGMERMVEKTTEKLRCVDQI